MKRFLIYKLEKVMVWLHRSGHTNLFLLTKIHSNGRNYRLLAANKKWKVWRRDNFQCAYCGLDEGILTIDHIVPRARGGTDAYSNLCACCMKCNNVKAARTAEEFLQSTWLKKRRKKIQKKKHTSTMKEKESITNPLETGPPSISNIIGESSLSTTIAQEVASGV